MYKFEEDEKKGAEESLLCDLVNFLNYLREFAKSRKGSLLKRRARGNYATKRI